ncbi:helix-turn-helix domain-containing protein [Alkalihalobacillus trypoxylicola]|uniref:Uncharacterized protein n=1 Tax=Alkalihalobacillus trypoxylicola TaxID=519424 RepID=A0A161PA97_9BACI|nr:helix-turn-helix transcriptional regulator [Alkalihalobacillus trypoxylicola]KYG28151.1 hypothetical protein AZF04_09615 [Alkalihalobacillus trypoxylicola]
MSKLLEVTNKIESILVKHCRECKLVPVEQKDNNSIKFCKPCPHAQALERCGKEMTAITKSKKKVAKSVAKKVVVPKEKRGPLDIDEVREIKRYLQTKELSQKELAVKYNVSISLISKINKGKRHSEVTI